MTKQAIIVKWHKLNLGLNDVPYGISVHKSEDDAYTFISGNAFLLDEPILVPDKMMDVVPVHKGTPLDVLFSQKASELYVHGADDRAFRQAKALVALNQIKVDLCRVGLSGIAGFVRDTHVSKHEKGQYRSGLQVNSLAL